MLDALNFDLKFISPEHSLNILNKIHYHTIPNQLWIEYNQIIQFQDPILERFIEQAMLYQQEDFWNHIHDLESKQVHNNIEIYKDKYQDNLIELKHIPMYIDEKCSVHSIDIYIISNNQQMQKKLHKLTQTNDFKLFILIIRNHFFNNLDS